MMFIKLCDVDLDLDATLAKVEIKRDQKKYIYLRVLVQLQDVCMCGPDLTGIIIDIAAVEKNM